MATRPKPKDDADDNLLFLMGHRRPWYRHGRFVEEGATVIKGIDNPVSRSFRELLGSLGINGVRNSSRCVTHSEPSARRARP